MTSKFEQLIEYVINDEEAKAKELFHDIVVEKSREIYENLMNEESDADRDDKAEKAGKKVAKDIEYDEKEDTLEEGMIGADDEEETNEGMEKTSGDASQDLMREVETEEEGMYEEDSDAEFDDEAEEDGEELTHDMEKDHDEGDIEDRVVDLEDKLDELMAEFESLMGDEAEEHGDDGFDMEPKDDEVGGDAYMNDDTSEFKDVEEEDMMPMSENVMLDPTPKPVTTEPSFVNKKATTAFNSGAAGMQGKPVRNTTTETNPDGTTAYKAPTSYADKGRGDLPGANKFKNVPGKDGYGAKMEPATKPHLAQATGVNTRTPFPKG